MRAQVGQQTAEIKREGNRKGDDQGRPSKGPIGKRGSKGGRTPNGLTAIGGSPDFIPRGQGAVCWGFNIDGTCGDGKSDHCSRGRHFCCRLLTTGKTCGRPHACCMCDNPEAAPL